MVAGQLTAAVLIDGLGLFGVEQIDITALRAVGVGVAFLGALAYRFAPANNPVASKTLVMSAESSVAEVSTV